MPVPVPVTDWRLPAQASMLGRRLMASLLGLEVP